MSFENLRKLALHSAQGTAPTNYTVETVNEAFRGELAKYCSSINQFMKNRYDIYEIIIETADTIVPAKVIDAMSAFAEVKTVGQGQKAMFKRSIGKNRARKFLTQVGLSGVYETFRLDNEKYEVAAKAIGGAVTIDFERLLDGAEVLADVMEVITEGLVDAVYGQVQRALKSALTAAKANRVIANTFNASQMLGIIGKVKAYGGGQAVIFAPPEFVAAMGPDAIVPVPGSGNYGGVYHPQDIDAIHNTGYITLFRGTPIVQIPQSYIDETNTTTWIDPQVAYVLPAGKQKVVKVVFEGQTQMHDFTNTDASMELHTYRKLGVAVEAYHNWGIYQNTGIAQTLDEVYDI